MLEDQRTKFEYKLFDTVITVGLIIWSLRVTKELFWTTSNEVLILDICHWLICMLSLFLIRKGTNRTYLIRAYCIIWLFLFPLYWASLGGFNGSMTYTYFSLLAVYNGLLRRKYRYIIVLILSLICFFLVFDYKSSSHWVSIRPYDHEDIFPNELYFIVNSIIVGLTIIYIKTSFDLKREKFKAYNESLEDINREVIEKGITLQNQQEEIKQIRNNLEQLVNDRTAELKKKIKQLEEYAYTNAHHIRGPLTNILSMINLIDLTSKVNDSNKEDLSSIKRHAEKLDAVIKKINTMLN